MKRQNSEFKDTQANRGLVRDELGDISLVKGGLWAKVYNDIWQRVNCKESPTMMFA